MEPLLLSLAVAALHLEGNVTGDGSDYFAVDFEVPAGTVEFEIAHTDNSEDDILDWGVESPEGFRGWGGGNTEPAVVGVEESSRSYLIGPITAGTWRVDVGKAKITSASVHYSIDIDFRTAATLTVRPRSAFTPVVLSNEARWYRGDFHVHSRESGDAPATFDEITTLVRSRGIDFVALSDHNTISHHPLIAAYQAGVDDVLFMRSIEVTTYAGHGGALGASQYVDHHIGRNGRTAQRMIEDITGQGALFIINHPTLDLGNLCIGCKWDHPDTPWDHVGAMELLTGPYGAGVALFEPQAVALWDQKLDEGFRITGVGGSDDHRAGIGMNDFQSAIGSPTTVVYANGLSEAAIIEGVRTGRVVVQLRGPEDPFVELFAVGGDGTRVMIGETLTSYAATVEAHVKDGLGFELILLRDGRTLGSAFVDSDDWVGQFPVDMTVASRVRAHLVSGANDVVITNHIWLEPGGAPPTPPGVGLFGCGCTGDSSPPGLLGGGLLLVAAWLMRRRG